jgi:TRAP-type C4-dicarboxylate transport system permease small subunit
MCGVSHRVRPASNLIPVIMGAREGQNQREGMQKSLELNRFFRKVDDGIFKAELVIGVSLTVVMVVAVFLQVVFRYVVNQPLSWSEELARYVFVWASMLGASMGVKRKSHFGLDALLKLFPQTQKKAIEIVLYCLMSIFLIVLVYYGTKFSSELYVQTAPGLNITMAVPYAAIPMGGLLMLCHILLMPFATSADRER